MFLTENQISYKSTITTVKILILYTFYTANIVTLKHKNLSTSQIIQKIYISTHLNIQIDELIFFTRFAFLKKQLYYGYTQYFI